jgi:hypothetical protein
MNNQLRKIVEQAVSAIDIVTGNEALDDELAKMYIPDCFAEKFAELIVEKCAGIIESQDVDPSFKLRMSWAVKQYFGVEE